MAAILSQPQWVKMTPCCTTIKAIRYWWTLNLNMMKVSISVMPWNGKTFCINTLRQRQNGCHSPDNDLKRIFLNENAWISIAISLKFVPRGPINNFPALVQIMAWRRPGDKPLSGPMMVRSPTHICVTQPQWVNGSHSSPVDSPHKGPVMQSFDVFVVVLFVVGENKLLNSLFASDFSWA